MKHVRIFFGIIISIIPSVFAQKTYVNNYKNYTNRVDLGVGVKDEVVLTNDLINAELKSTLSIGTQSQSPADFCNVNFAKSTLHAHLSLGEDFNYGIADFKIHVQLEINYKNQNSVIQNRSVNLVIEQDNTNLIHDVEAYFQENWTPIQDGVTSIEIIPKYIVAPNHPINSEDVQLKVFFNRDKKIKVDNVSIEQLTFVPEANSTNINFNWSSQCPDPTYEIQVLKLFNENAAFINHEEEIEAVINWKEAISIYTESKDQTYSMYFPYGEGHYLWRVRPIGNFHSKNGLSDSRDWGDWSVKIPNGARVKFNPSGIPIYIDIFAGDQLAKAHFYFKANEEDKTGYIRGLFQMEERFQSLCPTPIKSVRLNNHKLNPQVQRKL